MPSETGEDEKEYLTTQTEDIKQVADYARLDFEKSLELDCVTFRTLLKDAIIFRERQTKEGRDYLEDCYLIKQTNPDRKRLRQIGGGNK